MLNKKQIIEIKNQKLRRLNEAKDDNKKEPNTIEIRSCDDIIYTIHYLLGMLEKSIFLEEITDFETIYKDAKN